MELRNTLLRSNNRSILKNISMDGKAWLASCESFTLLHTDFCTSYLIKSIQVLHFNFIFCSIFQEWDWYSKQKKSEHEFTFWKCTWHWKEAPYSLWREQGSLVSCQQGLNVPVKNLNKEYHWKFLTPLVVSVANTFHALLSFTKVIKTTTG